MAETVQHESLSATGSDHPAAAAWRRLHPDQAVPNRVETIKLKHKTAAYRLWGVRGDGEAVVAKRCRAETAGVERLVYETLLPAAGVPALQCFGLVPEPASEFCWLFLEDAGAEAYSPASREHRGLAAGFLAALHSSRLSEAVLDLLPDRSPSHYLQLIRFSRATLQAHVGNPVLEPEESGLLRTFVARLDLMQARWEELDAFFENWPHTLVHGDFVIKNLRLRSGARGPQLLVFDWEMAGRGVPAVDLAQSVGKTASPDLETYSAALGPGAGPATCEGLARLAAYGRLLRLVDKVYWEAVTMTQPAYEFLVRPISTFQGYEPQLAAALRAVNWATHD